MSYRTFLIHLRGKQKQSFRIQRPEPTPFTKYDVSIAISGEVTYTVPLYPRDNAHPNAYIRCRDYLDQLRITIRQSGNGP